MRRNRSDGAFALLQAAPQARANRPCCASAGSRRRAGARARSSPSAPTSGPPAGGVCHTVGYVFQSPDNQIVRHRLARDGPSAREPQRPRRRDTPPRGFFGMRPWFCAQTSELSAASARRLPSRPTLAMRPRLLLLDEPTSMLDPIAEKAFLGLLFRANRELRYHRRGGHARAAGDGRVRHLRVCGGEGRARGGAVALAKPRPLARCPRARRPAGAAADVREAWLRYDRDGRLGAPRP